MLKIIEFFCGKSTWKIGKLPKIKELYPLNSIVSRHRNVSSMIDNRMNQRRG